jgi:hypothetical protein
MDDKLTPKFVAVFAAWNGRPMGPEELAGLERMTQQELTENFFCLAEKIKLDRILADR